MEQLVTVLTILVGIPVALLLAGFLMMVIIDSFGPAILTIFLFFKWTFSTIAELVRCLFRTKGDKDSV